jgi:predicted glutamine amidotransferase
MCRIIAYVGPGSHDLQRLFDAFRYGSQCDPYVGPICGNKYSGHPNGWGYAFYDSQSLRHYRSAMPVWDDTFALPPVTGQTVQAVWHSRLASDPSLDLPICSHPFIAAANDGIVLFAHNGGVNVADPTVGKLVVDSEWALAEIVRRGSLEQALEELKKQTKPNSALNLVVMTIPRDKTAVPKVQGLNYYKSEDPARIAYYQMFTANFAGGRAFLSSTFKETAGLTNVQLAPFGEIINLGAKASASSAITGNKSSSKPERAAIET